jgi:hypothetical protein
MFCNIFHPNIAVGFSRNELQNDEFEEILFIYLKKICPTGPKNSKIFVANFCYKIQKNLRYQFPTFPTTLSNIAEM